VTNFSVAESLTLERLDDNLFRGHTPPIWKGRIFGGQVIAQALMAAYATVENRPCHSLHAYFLRPGDPTIPIIFEVDRARDGGSFTTRRVIAVQRGEQIFNLAASFHAPEDGFDHQIDAPPHLPWPQTPPEIVEEFPSERATGWRAAGMIRPMEIRVADGDLSPDGQQEPLQQFWLRAIDPIGEDQSLQQGVLAFASDMGMLATIMRPHPINRRIRDARSASLDHAMWFHRPVDFNQWHLCVMDSPTASAGRGLARCSIYAAEGKLVASTAQEVVLRRPK